MNQARTFRFVLAFLFVLSLASGCVHSYGSYGDAIGPAELARIKIGETTQADVEQILGPPAFGMRTRYPFSQEVSSMYFTPSSMKSPVLEQVAGYSSILFGPAGILTWWLVMPHHSRSQNHFLFLRFNGDGRLIEISTEVQSYVGKTQFFMTSGHTGEMIDVNLVDQIQEGRSTAAEVEQLLGHPNLITKTSQKVTWGYKSTQYHGHQWQSITAKVKLDSGGKVLTKEVWRAHSVHQHHSNEPIARDKVLSIQVGKTTRTGVEQLLGPPREESVEERENLTELHYWTENIPNEAVTVTLDQDGIVKEVE